MHFSFVQESKDFKVRIVYVVYLFPPSLLALCKKKTAIKTDEILGKIQRAM